MTAKQWSPSHSAAFGLTPRQVEFVRLTCDQEETTKGAALAMKCSCKTIEYYRAQVYLRLGVNNPIALFKKAAHMGLVGLDRDPRRQQFPGFRETPDPVKRRRK